MEGVFVLREEYAWLLQMFFQRELTISKLQVKRIVKNCPRSDVY